VVGRRAMVDRAVGISTKNADEYVAAFTAFEQVEGHTRLVQLVGITSGKIPDDIGSPIRTVITDDPLDVTTVSGIMIVDDNSSIVCYAQHSQPDGICLVTPLLCDATKVVGCLPSKKSQTALGITTSGNYISTGLSWDIKGAGAVSVFPHISGLSAGNSISLWIFSI
jgi:hypothetical protein